MNTYKISRSISQVLGIDFTESNTISDNELHADFPPEPEQNKIYRDLGTKVWTGQKHTVESRRKISESLKKHVMTVDHKNALSESAKKRYSTNPQSHPQKGKKGNKSVFFGRVNGPPKKQECPYCKKMVAINNIMRYHYENCKWK